MGSSFEILFGAYRDSMPTVLKATPDVERAIRRRPPGRQGMNGAFSTNEGGSSACINLIYAEDTKRDVF
jgi:hypothetical protein